MLSMHYRARCSACGQDFYSPRDVSPPPCSRCGGVVLVFVPGPMVLWISLILLAAVFMGYVYWFGSFFLPVMYGRINYIPNNIIALSELALALLFLVVVTVAGVYALQSFRGSMYKTITAGVLTSASFGYGLSLAIGIVAIVFVVYYRDQYYR